jgi:outer membrane murein-binding lipoprotein Lpp
MNDFNVDSRLSRLETIMDSVSSTLEKIQSRLDNQGKVNWAPIAIGVTIFFTVAGSISTVYNARITTLNTAVESLAGKSIELEKGQIERRLQIQTATEKNSQQDEKLGKLEDRIIAIEKTTHR